MKKVSDNEYTLNFTGTDGKGKPVPPTSATCKKTAASASQ
jgi:hypothetical protein